MRSITTFDLQYAHRFYGFQGEAQYLHGHTGVLTIEVEDSVNMGVNMVYPCNEIQKVAANANGLASNFSREGVDSGDAVIVKLKWLGKYGTVLPEYVSPLN